MSEVNKTKLSPPWVNYFREIKALFGDDPDIKLEFHEDANLVKMYVNGQEKAAALAEILPVEKVFGNVSAYIDIIPDNKPQTKIDTFRAAFEGNPAFSYALSIGGMSSNDYNYVIFKNKVVQYYNDSLNDPHGNVSTLYEDIARDVFEIDGIMYSTDTPDNGGMFVDQDI